MSMHGNPASSASATASDSVQLPPGSYGYDDDADMAYAVSILSASDSFSTTEGRLVVTSPRGNTTSFEFRAALFGGNFPCAPLRLRVADPLDGCAELQGASTAQFIGAAVLVRRGDCFFENKARMVGCRRGRITPLLREERCITYQTSMLLCDRLRKLVQPP